ncbi:MAG TPA: ribulose-bisphosphate carboxylase large subunit family protein [Burkholderiaceae bacterium]|nr:ribulose-bisphosphate carboxylase large subunit family protein [Burkholderiaceae bacterium]
MDDRIRARYLIETAFGLEQAAGSMAGEQSTGTFVAVPGETPLLRQRNGAVVEAVRELGECAGPSLPGARVPRGEPPVWRRAEVTLSWPLRNCGPSLPNLMTMVAGNLFELGQFSGLRLLDIELPPAFAAAGPGPAFGIDGTRASTGVYGRPLIGTIIKPSIGLSAGETAAHVRALCDGGIDFIKDDELQSDGVDCPFEDRVSAVMRVIRDHAQRVGRQVMYAFNVTGDLDQMRRRHDFVLAQGGTCIMVSLLSVGLAGLLALRRDAQLVIHGHRNGWGALTRCPILGFDNVAWQKFWRLAGVDHLHVNGLRNKFCESDESVIASARACLQPMFAPPAPDCRIMPVFSSGQWAGQVHDTHAALGSQDLIHACGGGIAAHPGGIAAGVQSLHEAWAAAREGEPLVVRAQRSPALAQALTAFGATEARH